MENRIDAELSRLITQVTNETDWHMREQGLTRADLAGRMGVSPGRVSQVLSGGENLTLRTLATLAAALDAGFELQLKPREFVADSSVVLGLADTGSAVPDKYHSPIPQPGSLTEASGFSARR
jgi:transcriptional regulator with XRE-family HTH domain